MPRAFSMAIQSDTVARRSPLPCTAPASVITRACRASASVSVDLPGVGVADDGEGTAGAGVGHRANLPGGRLDPYSPQPIGNTSNDAANATPIRCPVCRAEALEELPRVPVLPAEPVDVGLVRLQRVDARVEGVGRVDAVRRPRASRPPTPRGRRPTARGRRSSCSGKIQRLPASRTASSTALPDRDVVGLVEVAAAEGVAEVAGDDDLGAVPAHRPRRSRAAARRRTPARRRAAAGTRPRRRPTTRGRRDLLGLAQRAGTRRGACRRCRPRRW